MSVRLEKLRPDQDLQCYFERPTAIAAISGATATGFTVSGCFRQQFDWAVIEWNRDNVFEHPAFRALPDGDLSGLVLRYEETRHNCIPLDSDLYPTVEWPYLRIWADEGGRERLFRVRIRDYAEPVEGEYRAAEAEFELRGEVTAGDHVGLAWLWEHYTYEIAQGDTLESVVARLAESVNAFSSTMRASASGARIRLIYVGAGQTLENSRTGLNGNRLGAYGFVAGAKTEFWEPWFRRFEGGVSPSRWRITLDFSDLRDEWGERVPTRSVRKMRWTYAADLQAGAFVPCEFEVRVENWSVTGSGRTLSVAGPGSRRIEDNAPELRYSGEWHEVRGNFSGGSARYTSEVSSGFECHYRHGARHELFLGLRRCPQAGEVEVELDGSPAARLDLNLAGEEVLVRIPLGVRGPGEHTVRVRHLGPQGRTLCFDFIELAVPSQQLPRFPDEPAVALATDWDTDHCLAVAPERTAWMLRSLGLRGVVNHYLGALWFYELEGRGFEYAHATVRFTGTPQFSEVTQLRFGRVGQPAATDTVITHLNLIGDTAETIAKAFELEINRGYTAIRAEAHGEVLVIYARVLGSGGNEITIAASPTEGPFRVEVSGPTLAGGRDGYWRTKLGSKPRLNRAARDWHRAYYRALKEHGFEVVSALSMELQHGDPSEDAGIAQRYPDGAPVMLNTPALQTNFSTRSLEFWREVYTELAVMMKDAGLVPFLQFGEVQWWYFPNESGMPYYDTYTKEAFEAKYGRALRVIRDSNASPDDYREEASFLAQLLGEFTTEIMAYVRQATPECRFEVLYPTDVNEAALNRVVNLPTMAWNGATLDRFKTESFLFTYGRNLEKARRGWSIARDLGFPPAKRSHLIGISDYTTPWLKELRLARSEGLGEVVLFALDQFCLIGYPLPLGQGMRRAWRLS